MANPKRTAYGLPSQWVTAYNVNPMIAAQLSAARANALPQGRNFQLAAHGFTYLGNRRYSLVVNGLTAHLFYNLTTAGWDVTCPEIGLNRFFGRLTPAAEIRTALIGAMMEVINA